MLQWRVHAGVFVCVCVGRKQFKAKGRSKRYTTQEEVQDQEEKKQREKEWRVCVLRVCVNIVQPPPTSSAGKVRLCQTVRMMRRSVPPDQLMAPRVTFHPRPVRRRSPVMRTKRCVRAFL